MIQDTVEREIESAHGTVTVEGFECYHCGEFTPKGRVLGVGIGEGPQSYETQSDIESESKTQRINVEYAHSIYVCEYCAEALYNVEDVTSADTLGALAERTSSDDDGQGGLPTLYWLWLVVLGVLVVVDGTVVPAIPNLFILALITTTLVPLIFEISRL